MKTLHHEVIIVGSGPAGATAAMALAQKGRDVLLLDRQPFPRDKVCGDGIPAGAIGSLYRYGLKEKIEQSGYYPITRIAISSPGGSVLEADLQPGEEGATSYVIPRLEFDAMLQEHALASGAVFCQGQVQEPILENGRVTGVWAKIDGRVQALRAQVVIGADGVTSVIGRALRPSHERHQDHQRAIALRAYVDGIVELPHQVEFFLYKAILPGYAWIFPTGNGRANIGLGIRLDKFRQKKQSLQQMLDIFLDIPAVRHRFKNSQLHDVASWQLNFGSQKHLHHAFDGALLVGDAAGLINPLTGGGIDNAIISAGIAADVVNEALTRRDVSRAGLRQCEKRCHEAMWGGMQRSYLVQRWLLTFPWLVDLLVRYAKKNTQFVQMFSAKL